MYQTRRRVVALAATAATIAATVLAATPAHAAASGTAKVSGTTVIFTAAADTKNLVSITRSGRTVTIDDRVAIKAGAGCKPVSGDKTKVKCTTRKQPKRLKISLGARHDLFFNQTSIASSVTGGTGPDQLSGGSAADVLDGGSGNDHLMAGAGNDTVLGGTGKDHLAGNTGSDTMYGGSGDDGLRGSSGDDAMYGESGGDSLQGDAGDDILEGGSGTDNLRGNAGDDELWTEPEDSEGHTQERANGGSGSDYCYVPVGTATSCEYLH